MQERKLTSTDKYFIQQHSKHKVINHSQRMAIISTKPDTNNNLAVSVIWSLKSKLNYLQRSQ